VLCRTGTRDDGKPELSCILVETGTPGYSARAMHDKMMWRASNTSELYFEDCRVPAENLLGTRGHGFYQMMQTLDCGRLSIGAMGLGGAQGCFERALNYCQQREQFGRPIARFQVNAFKLADMALEIDAARLMLYRACWLRDNDQPYSKEAAMAKLYCSKVMYRCANHAVQFHGGYGLMREYDVERFYRDQKLLEIGEGTSEIQRIVIARHIGALKGLREK
jgi:short/branched chain acyl-CoA dehydrogenase